VPQTYSIDVARDTPLVPVNDNDAGAGRCPGCNRPASTAPTASEYRGKGIIHHHWLCRVCGHEWTTVLHVPV